jgi:hypothetical protein
MKKVKVLIDTLHHDGLLRQPGDILEIENSQADVLIGLGAVEVGESAQPARKSAQKTKTDLNAP